MVCDSMEVEIKLLSEYKEHKHMHSIHRYAHACLKLTHSHRNHVLKVKTKNELHSEHITSKLPYIQMNREKHIFHLINIKHLLSFAITHDESFQRNDEQNTK